MRTRLRVILGAAIVTMGGCTGEFVDPPLNRTHPANAAAPTAPLPDSSSILSVESTKPISAAPASAAASQPAAAYVCPMHPEVVSDAPGKCPKCGMKLIANDTESGREP